MGLERVVLTEDVSLSRNRLIDSMCPRKSLRIVVESGGVSEKVVEIAITAAAWEPPSSLALTWCSLAMTALAVTFPSTQYQYQTIRPALEDTNRADLNL